MPAPLELSYGAWQVETVNDWELVVFDFHYDSKFRVHLFKSHLLRAPHVLGTRLNTRVTIRSKRDTVSPL